MKRLKNRLLSILLGMAVLLSILPAEALKVQGTEKKNNQIENGNFEQGWTGWETYFNEANSGTAEITSDYRAAIHMNFFLNWYTDEGDKGPVDWSTQLMQKGITVEKGKTYKLRFTASSTVERPIAVEVKSGSASVKEYFVLGNENRTYELDYTAGDSSLDLSFLMGQITSEQYPDFPYTTAEFEKHSIYITDVKLTDSENSEVEKTLPGIIGVEDGANYQTPVSIKVNYRDNPYTLELTKDGQKIPYKEGTEIWENGTYMVTVTDNTDSAVTVTRHFTIELAMDYSKDWIVIANKSTEKVMEAGGSTEGSSLVQSTYAGRASQFFTMEDSGADGYVKLRSLSTNYVIDVADGSAADSAKLVLASDNGKDSQLWQVDDTISQGYVKFINKASGKAINVSGASKTEGLALTQAANTGNGDEGQQNTDGQRWDIIRSIDVREAVEGKQADVSTPETWAAHAVLAPVRNGLNPAGALTVEFYPLAGAASYEIYFDGEKTAVVTQEQLNRASVKDSFMMTDEGTVKVFEAAYSTKTAKHTLYIQTDTGVRTNTVEFFLSKKGVGWATLHRTADMNLSWYYRWSLDEAIGTDEYLEFVPMIWGNYGDDWLKDSANKKYGTVLSFNEPDWSDQSNVPVTIASSQAWADRYNAANGTNITRPASVEEAWQSFMDSGLRIGSPATAIAPPYCNGSITMNGIDGADNWWYDFMDLMKTHSEDGWDYDFVAIHCYDAGCDAKSFLKMVDDTHEMTGKPVWITEFGVAEWNENRRWSGGNEETKQQVMEFMMEVLEGLEERDFVERYAWFPFNPNDAYGGASGIFDYETGELTELGKIYASFGVPEGYDPQKRGESNGDSGDTGTTSNAGSQTGGDDSSQSSNADSQTGGNSQNSSDEPRKTKPAVKWNVSDKTIPLQLKNNKKINKTTALQPVGLQKGDSIAKYKSSNTKVATVKKDSRGKLTITPKKTGTTKITVTTKYGAAASIKLKVQKAAVKVVRLTVKNVKKNKLTLKKGKTFTLQAEKKYITALDKVTFSSSNKKVVSVSSKGKLKAKKKGKAKITVRCQKKKAVITVTVK